MYVPIEWQVLPVPLLSRFTLIGLGEKTFPQPAWFRRAVGLLTYKHIHKQASSQPAEFGLSEVSFLCSLPFSYSTGKYRSDTWLLITWEVQGQENTEIFMSEVLTSSPDVINLLVSLPCALGGSRFIFLQEGNVHTLEELTPQNMGHTSVASSSIAWLLASRAESGAPPRPAESESASKSYAH